MAERRSLTTSRLARSATQTEVPTAAPARHWRFKVDDYAQMAASCIFTGDDRVELIEGEIFEMSPVGGSQMKCVNNLT